MSTVKDTINTGLKLTAIALVAALATGCISAKSKPTEEAEPAAPAPAPAPVAPVAAPVAVEPEPQALTSWTVAEGNHLLGISGTEEVYNVPEQWPLI